MGVNGLENSGPMSQTLWAQKEGMKEGKKGREERREGGKERARRGREQRKGGKKKTGKSGPWPCG